MMYRVMTSDGRVRYGATTVEELKEALEASGYRLTDYIEEKVEEGWLGRGAAVSFMRDTTFSKTETHRVIEGPNQGDLISVPAPDMVNHPPHYTAHPKGIECIDVIEDNPFLNLGNAMKYIWRVSWGSKGRDIEDLEKAVWYVQREIKRRNPKS